MFLASFISSIIYLLATKMKRDVRDIQRRETIGGSYVAVKSDVNVSNLDPVLGKAIDVARSVGLSPVVTSALRPDDTGSLHSEGLALDFRSHHLSYFESQQVEKEMQEKLGNDWDVVLESNPEHFHVEYDP